jgi:hypothetical protein
MVETGWVLTAKSFIDTVVGHLIFLDIETIFIADIYDELRLL